MREPHLKEPPSTLPTPSAHKHTHTHTTTTTTNNNNNHHYNHYHHRLHKQLHTGADIVSFHLGQRIVSSSAIPRLSMANAFCFNKIKIRKCM